MCFVDFPLQSVITIFGAIGIVWPEKDLLLHINPKRLENISKQQMSIVEPIHRPYILTNLFHRNLLLGQTCSYSMLNLLLWMFWKKVESFPGVVRPWTTLKNHFQVRGTDFYTTKVVFSWLLKFLKNQLNHYIGTGILISSFPLTKIVKNHQKRSVLTLQASVLTQNGCLGRSGGGEPDLQGPGAHLGGPRGQQPKYRPRSKKS